MTKAKTRRYESALRREQAEETRRHILAAAETLFEEKGYGSTSITEIASQAGVSEMTVYGAFGTKSGLLRALWHLRLRGDEEAIPVHERPWYREMLEEPDPKRQIHLNVRNATAVRRRVGRLLEVVRDAAPGNADVAELWKTIEREFHQNQRALIESLREKGALKRRLSTDRAADILWTLNHPNTYLLLVRGRGWTVDQHAEWLEEVLGSELLGGSA
jgi:AcrR family transcriptional regulator